MDVNEALELAGESSIMTDQVGPVIRTLAAEVRRLQAVEAVPACYALADLDGNLRSWDDGELVVKPKPFLASGKTDCIPLYTNPPATDVCNMQYMGNTVGYIYQKMEAYRHQLWQVKALDEDTRKLVLELCDVVENYTDIPLTKQIREKLGAGDE